MSKLKISVLVPLLAVFVFACGDTDTNTDCTEVSLDGTRYCAWEKAIIVETGYECPSDLSFFHDFEKVAVCSDVSTPPTEEIVERIEGEILTDSGDNSGGTCTTDADCTDGKSCSIGACVQGCSVSSDCDSGESCAPTIDGPVPYICVSGGTCESIESWYSQANGFDKSCQQDSDCRALPGNCGDGLGDCWELAGGVPAQADATFAYLADLRDTFTGMSCMPTSGVCSCPVTPTPVCNNNVCENPPGF